MPQPAPAPAPAPEHRKSSAGGCFRGCLVAAGVVFIVLCILFAVCAVLCAGAFSKGLKDGFAKSGDDFSGDASGLKEVWSADLDVPADLPDDAAPAKAVRIPLMGTIDFSSDEPGFFGSSCSSATTLRAIRRAIEDDSVDAILLEVDSGGGGITASDILYHALMLFKESDPDRKIVVLMGDMAASGAYYASLPADRIIAHPTTITGSIGVILSSLNVQQLTDRLGVVDNSITSGRNKAILNPMRELTEEQRALLQGTVDELYARFAGLVSTHRGIPMEKVKEIADGRIYTANQAKELGLVDDIGYLEDAEVAVYELLGSPANGVEFYEYERRSSLRDIMSSPDFWGAALSRALPGAASGNSGVQAR